MLHLDPLAVANLVDRLSRRPHIAQVFRAVPMPPGCAPDRTDLRLEASPSGGVLLVAQPFSYDGHDGELHRWSRDTAVRCAGVPEAHAWFVARWSGAPLTGAPPVPAPAPTTEPEGVAPLLLDPDELTLRLQDDVTGQPAAVRTTCEAVAVHLAQRRPAGPVVVLAVGATGTGKSWTGTCLARVLDIPSVVVDLAEHAESHRVSSLLGAPPGYVGAGERSALLAALDARPRTLVVLDEWEKAHPSVRQSLLAFFDAGRLTAGDGHAVCAPQAVVLVTTNLGADALVRDLDRASGWDDATTVERVVRTVLLDHGVAPELLGRVTAFAAYRPLAGSVRAELAGRALQTLTTSLGLVLRRAEPEVVSRLLAHVDGRAGARGLRTTASRLAGPALLRSGAAQGQAVVLAVDGGRVVARVEPSR